MPKKTDKSVRSGVRLCNGRGRWPLVKVKANGIILVWGSLTGVISAPPTQILRRPRNRLEPGGLDIIYNSSTGDCPTVFIFICDVAFFSPGSLNARDIPFWSGIFPPLAHV
jgi:hypothetical protein